MSVIQNNSKIAQGYNGWDFGTIHPVATQKPRRQEQRFDSHILQALCNETQQGLNGVNEAENSYALAEMTLTTHVAKYLPKFYNDFTCSIRVVLRESTSPKPLKNHVQENAQNFVGGGHTSIVISVSTYVLRITTPTLKRIMEKGAIVLSHTSMRNVLITVAVDKLYGAVNDNSIHF